MPDPFDIKISPGHIENKVEALQQALKKQLDNRSDGSTATYYQLPQDATQLQDLISYRNMNSQIGEIFRACYRYGKASHSDQLRDAKKILFYARAEIRRLEEWETEGNG